MRRREFITLLGGAAAAWPVAVRAQQGERMRRIGVLMNTTANTEQQQSLVAFQQALQQLGWTEGRNVQMDIRWAGGDAREIRRHAGELVALAPDVIVATGNAGMVPLLQATRIIPIVFNNVADPVGGGFVKSMARPGGNATGFIQFEYSLSAKWLETLKEIMPSLTRVAVLRDAALASGIGQFAVIQSVASSLRVETSAIDVRDTGEIESDIADFARTGTGGLILTSSALAVVHRSLIITLAARHRLPAIFYRRAFVDAGGLISYGYDVVDQYRRSGGYVDRILKGEKPADLPVQAPTQVRTGHQPQDRQGARPRRADLAARPRRRGDRMITAPRVHHAARWCGGGMADCSARAAGRPHPPRRGLDRWKRQRSHKPTTRYDLSRCHARARLDGRPQRQDRCPFPHHQRCGRNPRRRRRTRRAQSRCDRDNRRAHFGGVASRDQDRADRVHAGH